MTIYALSLESLSTVARGRPFRHVMRVNGVWYAQTYRVRP